MSPEAFLGVDRFAAFPPDPAIGSLPSAADRMAELLEETKVADRVGLDVFGISERHRAEYLDSGAHDHSCRCGGPCQRHLIGE